MKKRIIQLVAAVALSTAGASAQGFYPTAYHIAINDMYEMLEIHETWSDVVKGKPGQGLGLVKPGVKKVTAKIDNGPDMPSAEWTYELHPNGLIKSDDAQNGRHTYNYDKQWRLQSIVDKDGKVEKRYIYDDKGRLKKYIHDMIIHNEYDYDYDANGNLTTIKKGKTMTITVKDSAIAQVQFFNDYDMETWPTVFTYDQQGRWKMYSSIVADGMDEIEIVRTQYTWNYGTGNLPIGLTRRQGVYDPKKKQYAGKPEVTNIACTFTLDSKGNWTGWKLKGGYINLNITRTIEYYNDDEVKAAVAEMEAARQGKKQPKEEKKEELWEF